MRGVFGGEQGGLWQGDQFLLGHSQHRVTPPAESLQILASLRAATERSCPGSATLAQPRGQLPWSGASSATVSPGATSIPAVPFACRGRPHPSSQGCLMSTYHYRDRVTPAAAGAPGEAWELLSVRPRRLGRAQLEEVKQQQFRES